jgi:hypothetical protein
VLKDGVELANVNVFEPESDKIELEDGKLDGELAKEEAKDGRLDNTRLGERGVLERLGIGRFVEKEGPIELCGLTDDRPMELWGLVEVGGRFELFWTELGIVVLSLPAMDDELEIENSSEVEAGRIWAELSKVTYDEDDKKSWGELDSTAMKEERDVSWAEVMLEEKLKFIIVLWLEVADDKVPLSAEIETILAVKDDDKSVLSLPTNDKDLVELLGWDEDNEVELMIDEDIE